MEGYGDQVVQLLGAGVATKAISSLVLHQCDLPVKVAILQSMASVLANSGRLMIADDGLQRTLLMKLLFRQVPALDGWERTGLNAKGVLPDLIAEAGFQDVAEVRVIPTPTGSILLYAAGKS